MNYKTSSPTVKCEKCEEHLTDFEQYEKHMAHMHGLNTSEESVVDWTLITDEDIITKDGNKYRVGGESINWSPNFDKEARIFLEEKYQKGKIDMLSKKKINEAKKFVKALEFDTNKHYDNLINKIEGKGEDSYNELFPNEKQVFPQNKMPSKKWFSHQKNQADVTDVIQDQGYFDDPNEVMGSQTKKFSKGKYHIDEPVAKEQFSTSFYGDYLGESKASERSDHDNSQDHDEDSDFKYHEWEIDEDFPEDVRCGICGASMSKSEYANKKLAGESKANEVDGYTVLDKDGYETPTWYESDNLSDAKREADRLGGSVLEVPSFGGELGNTIYTAGESKANEGESVVNKHGVEYELDDEDDGLYNDLYYQQIDEGDEKEVFELLDKYNDNYPYASLKDMENEIERTIGWVSDDRDIQTLVLQWQDFRYS